MKTSSLLVAAFTLAAGYSVYQSQQKEQLSDIALENVEALAGGESNGDCSDCIKYYNGICEDWGWGGCLGRKITYEV